MPLIFDSQSPPDPETGNSNIVRFQNSHNAMGTTFDVVAYGHRREYLAEVINEVFDEIDRLEQQLSLYLPESELSHINRTAARLSTVVEPGLFNLIREAIRYSAETSGAFDITIAPLMKSWGFFRQRGRVPDDTEIAQALKKVGYPHVKLDATARTVWFDEVGVELDLGGIGKGFAVDRATQILRSSGVINALISSGTSSIFAMGAPPQSRAWTITLRDPFDAAKGADVIHLKNCSISTSGSYENLFKLNGTTYSHIMDPVTGRSVEGILSATVLALDVTESEALSTAFYVMGPERASHYVAAHSNLTVIYYQPAAAAELFKRVVARSSFNDLPPDVVAEIEPPQPSDEEVQKLIRRIENGPPYAN